MSRARAERGADGRREPEIDAEVVVLSGVPPTMRDGAVRELAVELLRRGARSVVLPRWPVAAEPEALFLDGVRDSLDAGAACVVAVQESMKAVRGRFPAARDSAAWCVFGSGGTLEERS
jgi:hypothetical protein